MRPLALFFISIAECAAAAGPRLCVEYLPQVIYDDEALTACVRVEGAGEFRVAARLLDAKGRALASHAASGRAAAGKPWRAQLRLRPGRGEPALLELSLSTAKEARPVAGVKARVVNLTRPLRPLEVKGLRLVGEKGQAVVLRIAHRVRQIEQRWPLVRWIRYKLYGDRVKFDRVAIVGEDLGKRDGYLAGAARALEGLEVAVLAVRSRGRESGPPVLRAIAAASQKAWRKAPDLVAFSLGHTEDDLGTDPLVFGRGLEALVQHFEALGARHFVVVAPAGPPDHAARLVKYVRQAKRVAHVYRARYADLGGALAGCWRVGDDRATLRFPSREGHERLGRALAEFIRALRR